MPTPAGATGTSPGAAAGAVSKCVRTSSVLSTNFSTSSQFKSRSSLARTPSLRFYLPPSLFTYVASTSPLENDCGGVFVKKSPRRREGSKRHAPTDASLAPFIHGKKLGTSAAPFQNLTHPLFFWLVCSCLSPSSIFQKSFFLTLFTRRAAWSGSRGISRAADCEAA